jgi:hypothetical protein
MRRTLWAVIVGGVVAVLAYVLVAPLGCSAAVEVIDTAPGTEITGAPRAGPVTCTRLLLPDYEGPADPARWPPALAAVALGVLVGFALMSRGPTGDAPPPGER